MASDRPIPRLWLALGLLGLGLLVFHRVVLGEVFVHVDFHQTFEPQLATLQAALARGAGWWDPRLGNGSSIVANPLRAASYPLARVLRYAEPAVGLTWLAVLHLVLAGFGALGYGRHRGLSPPSALAAAAVFAFSGLTVSTVATCSFLWTLAWAPWLLWGVERLIRDETPAWYAVVPLGGAGGMLLLAGEPFVIAPVALGIGLRLLTSLRSDRARWPRVTVGGAVALGLALVMAGPQLVAVARLLPSTVRAGGFTADGVLQWSLHPVELIGLGLSDPLGDPTDYGPGSLWGGAIDEALLPPLFAGMYVGGVALALALLGAWVSRHRWYPDRWYPAAWFALLVALALGRYGPVYPLLLPLDLGFVASSRYPVKWLIVGMLPLGLLVGRGVEAIVLGRASRRQLRAALLGALVTVGVAAAALALLVGASADADLTAAARVHLSRSAVTGSIPLMLAWLVAGRLGREDHHNGRVALALVGLIAIDLALHNTHLAPTVAPSFYRTTPAYVAALRADPAGLDRVTVEPAPPDLSFTPPLTTTRAYFAWQRAAGQQLIPAAYGIDLAFQPDTEALAPVAYAQFGSLALNAPPREKAMLLGAAGVSHLIRFGALDTTVFDALATIATGATQPLRVYRNRLVQPRARLVRRLVPYDGLDGFVATVSQAPEDLFRDAALVERSQLRSIETALHALGVEMNSGCDGPPGATIVLDRGEQLEIEVSGCGGLLVVSDTMVVGWRAWIDAEEVPIVVADLAFRALPVPPGPHRVTMRYNPWR